jgi:hypothetical protein
MLALSLFWQSVAALAPYPTRARVARSTAISMPLGDYYDDELFQPISARGLNLVSSKPYIFTIDNFLSDAECRTLISKMSDQCIVEELPSSEKLQQCGERTSCTVVPQNAEVAGLRRRLADLVNVELSQMQPLKITRYDRGGVFVRHTDCTKALANASTADTAVYPNRFCTVLLYLNDVARGGKTCWRWRDTDPDFYTRQRARLHGLSPLVEQAMASVSQVRRKLLSQPRPDLCIAPRRGTAVVHFPCTSASAGLVMDINADHESEPAVDTKYVCQQFIWSTPMDAELVDERLRSVFRRFEEQQPSEPLSDVVV